MTPLIALGAGFAVPAILTAVTKAVAARVPDYAVVWIGKDNGTNTQNFADKDKAAQFQNHLVRQGLSSVLVKRDATGKLDTEHPLRALKVEVVSTLPPSRMRKLTGRHDDFDATEEQLKVTDYTTRFPDPEWARRAVRGPYPETAMPKETVLPLTPIFRGTTSSHEWESDAVPDTSLEQPWMPPEQFGEEPKPVEYGGSYFDAARPGVDVNMGQ